MALVLTDAEALRFVRKIRVTETGCWEWTAALTRGNSKQLHDYGGYGKFSLRGRTRLAHVVMYEALHGRASGQIDHLCRNRACVRPRCLEDVTPQVNALRSTGFAAVNAAKTICKNGHPYTSENTGKQSGGRECRACRRDIYRRYRQRKRTRCES